MSLFWKFCHFEHFSFKVKSQHEPNFAKISQNGASADAGDNLCLILVDFWRTFGLKSGSGRDPGDRPHFLGDRLKIGGDRLKIGGDRLKIEGDRHKAVSDRPKNLSDRLEIEDDRPKTRGDRTFFRGDRHKSLGDRTFFAFSVYAIGDGWESRSLTRRRWTQSSADWVS